MSLNNEAFQLKFVCIECILPKQFLVVFYAATEKVKKRQKQTEKKAGEFNTKSEIESQPDENVHLMGSDCSGVKTGWCFSF